MRIKGNQRNILGVLSKSALWGMVFIAQILLTVSCEKKLDAGAGEGGDAGGNSRFVGTWEASGPDVFGAYGIQMVIKDGGECEGQFVFQEKDSNLSMQQTDTVSLVGSWEVRNGKMATNLKAVSWINSNPRGSTKELEVEDFSFSYTWELEGERLVMAGSHGIGSFKVGTTREAREGLKMIYKGKGRLVDFTEFVRVSGKPAVEDPQEGSEPKLSEGPTKKDPVGEWATKNAKRRFSLCFWESGEAAGEFEYNGNSIYLDGRWQVVKEGRWMGYVIFSGKVDYWGVGSVNRTPKDEKFEFMFELTDSRLSYVRGGRLRDKEGGEFHPSGVQANEDPVLYRLNKNRPLRREPGNK